MSTEETAYYLGTSPRTVHRFVTSGRLRVLRNFHKHWRFDVRDVEEFIENCKREEQ
jgi:excisionase family DNA binding protein